MMNSLIKIDQENYPLPDFVIMYLIPREREDFQDTQIIAVWSGFGG